jgi:rhamnosyltransferase
MGFDFGAWKDAMLKDGWEKISQYDNLTLMNDTCFGPLFDLENIYLDMEKKDIDFWGLTNHKNDKFGMPGTNRPVPNHMQSYFICFNRNVVTSVSFQNFWRNIRYEKKIEKVIQKYETQFTKILVRAGFKYSVFLDKTKFPETKYDDLTIMRPHLCMDFKVPFLKIKCFLYFPYPGYIISMLRKNTSYPVSIVLDYLNQIYNPNVTIAIQNKLISNKNNIAILQNVKIAIHLHSYYTDILDRYVLFLNTTNVNSDLFITTDSTEKKDIIYNFLRDQACFSKLKEIIITENRGRDILPWLSIHDRLNNYDIVGHFHTKKSLTSEEWIGQSWTNDLTNSLLHDINTIVNEFCTNRSLGVIIPEVPYIFRAVSLPGFSEYLCDLVTKLWTRLKCKKEINFKNIKSLIFPIGTMFWYRPVALMPLFNLELSRDDVGCEPIPGECILHAIERLIVYIAWNEGYDYRISLPTEVRSSSFIDINRVCETINHVYGSFSYRIGRIILFLPRKIRYILRHILRI